MLCAKDFLEQDILVIPKALTIDEAVSFLKKKASSSPEPGEAAAYLYAIHEDGRLAGVIQMRDLVLSSGHKRLEEIMKTEVVALKDTLPEAALLDYFRKHRFLALPVVDAAGRLLGAVKLSRITELLEKEAEASLYQATGMKLDSERDFINREELSHRSILKMVMLRSPWLLLSILSGLVAAFILGNYFFGIETIISLILFIPIVLGLSGSMARQCAVLVTQEFAGGGSVSLKKIFQIMAKESLIAVFSGLLTLVAVGLVALVLKKSLLIALAIGLAIGVAILLSGTLGVLFPFLFVGLRLDPKIASGPLTVAVCDLFALWIYLRVAYFFLSA